MHTTRKFLFILIILSFLAGCATQPMADPQVDAPVLEAAATASPTSPPPTSTPTPAPVALTLETPPMEHAELVEEKGDGAYFYPFDASLYQDQNTGKLDHPLTPAFLWHIEYAPNSGIETVVVEFDVLGTLPADEVPGYERAVFVGLYNLETIGDDGLEHANSPKRDRDDILLDFLFEEDMLRYAEILEGTDGARHYTVTIPYEQFNGRKPELAVQFLPGTTFTSPSVTVVASARVAEDDIWVAITEGAENPVPDHSWLDEYWHDEWDISTTDSSGVLNEFFATSGKVPEEGRFYMVPAGEIYYQVSTFNPSIYKMPAVEFGLENEIEGDYVFVPSAMRFLDAWMMQEMYHESEDNHPLEEEVIFFVQEHMIDPETGLIHGVWDFTVSPQYGKGRLIKTDEVYSNFVFLSSINLHDPFYWRTRESRKEAFAIAYQVLVNAVDQEIVEAPNGKLVIAPQGIGADQTIHLALEDLGWGMDNIAMFYDLLRLHDDGERARRLFDAYANTLQFLMEAQQETPSNLLSEEVNIHFAEDGTYTFEYIGDFDISNPFFMHLMMKYEGYIDLKNKYVDIRWLDYAYLIKAYDDVDPYAWEERIQEAYVGENGERIAFPMYTILYNTYTFMRHDGYYTGRYAIEDGSPLYSDPRDTDYPAWEKYKSHYGSFNNRMAEMMLARVFHDPKMFIERYSILSKGLILFKEDYFRHHNDGNFAQTSQAGFGVFTNSYALLYISPEFYPFYKSGGGNLPPWWDAGRLAWRETVDSILARFFEKMGGTPTPAVAP